MTSFHINTLVEILLGSDVGITLVYICSWYRHTKVHKRSVKHFYWGIAQSVKTGITLTSAQSPCTVLVFRAERPAGCKPGHCFMVAHKLFIINWVDLLGFVEAA